MCSAYRRDPNNPNNVFVANIVLCKGVPFYGYHVGWSPYLKIYLLNPSHVTKCADLLRTGAIQGIPMQPYESHIPHTLQFLADFNLYGCGWMRISDAWFRGPLPDEFSIQSPEGRGLDINSRMLSRNHFSRFSFSELEIDITADFIENRHDLMQHNIHADFESERKMSLPKDYKHLISMRELWREDYAKRHAAGNLSYKPPPDITRTGEELAWSRLEELERDLDERIISATKGKPVPKLETFVDKVEFDSYIPTAFEIVDYMFRRKPKQVNIEPVIRDEGNANHIDEADGQTLDDKGSDTDEAEDEDIEDPNALANEEKIERVPQLSLKRLSQDNSFSLSQKKSKLSRRDTTDSSFSYFSEDFNAAVRKSSLVLLSQGDYPSVSSHGASRLESILEKFHIKSALGLCVSAPNRSEVASTMEELGEPSVIYKEPYFSKLEDVPEGPFVHAGVEFRLKSDHVSDLPEFDFSDQTSFSPIEYHLSSYQQFHYRPKRTVQYLPLPPSRQQVEDWTKASPTSTAKREKARKPGADKPQFLSQINGPTQWNPYGYKFASQKKTSQIRKHISDREMSVLVVEVHVNTRPGKLPNPQHDPVSMIFWGFKNSFADELDPKKSASGVLAYGDDSLYDQLESIGSSKHALVQVVDTELELINTFVRLVRYYDPDILSGYEIHNSSLGYIIERGRENFSGYDLCVELSRVQSNTNTKFNDRWGYTQASAIRVTGRHMLNIWRVIRHELNLLQYTIENVVFHTLHDRIPHYNHDDLTKWTQSGLIAYLEIVVNYYLSRVEYDIKIIDDQHLITRNSEQARLLGIDFYSVLSRGSQYKVESSMTRLAKKENFIMISPSKKQVGQQNALEHIPLVMEPLSGYYTSPVLVLDFQSLYPSIVIAYNYCYSTCLGRVKFWRGRNKLGVIDLDVDSKLLDVLKDDLTIAPNGLIFVKEIRRKSLLAKMLSEILDTRVMVKAGMKLDQEPGFQNMMNNRQLALKLIANVTYGYTSATYSGRMPCAEIADSIVLSAREILENTIRIIGETTKWGAEVVYGDTDSIFVHLPGKSKDQAFEIGNDIANYITSINPSPIKLKFEKVYMGSVLLTKKRYVGYMYETPDQKVPVFDAKGIETVRRDGTPAEQKIEEKALRLLFETSDLSKVKEFLHQQWRKIMTGNISVQDFCFAKEVRMGTYKEGGTLPPGAAVSAKKMEKDERAEPQYRERVPYVVISGPPGSRLVDRCVSPDELVNNANYYLDSDYYIKKNLIPPLERIFNILGANVQSWYDQMPKVIRFQPIKGKGENLRNYIKSASCIICKDKQTNDGICSECREDPAGSMLILQKRIKYSEEKVLELEAICRNCSGISPVMEVRCDSGDCPIYYSRKRAIAKFDAVVSEDMSLLDLNW
ncbi:Rev3p [Sugiyamaella lignohabitans]|uniref:DNA polymerase n=1 Tax=Sugiyamaella lignohabitans TaxID=796027 RepID=A0A161HKH0_9ASCO|nr:Rev3p [Sugiyamaella lignohabitans]ANB12188.1 Rev3p [Sugiyamaella lignohabitans]